MTLCELGCGQEAKHQNKSGKKICAEYSTQCPEIRKKNSSGLRRAHSDGIMKSGFSSEERKAATIAIEEKFMALPFEKKSWERRRKIVVEEQENKCLMCGLSMWLGQNLNLQIDHIDGNNSNNKRENLRALCANCHSLTDTYCGKNINKGIKKVSDEVILQEIKKGLNNRQILVNIGLTPKGGNYNRINRLRNTGE
jgi:flagellar biosynthesis/type III secretory pathway ATPase